MASVSASHLILFIASMMIAASVAGVFTNSIGQLSGALSEQGLDVSSDVRTDVEIISDSGSDAIYENGTITLYVKNTGTERLAADPGAMDILVDGRFVTEYNVTRADGSGAWTPGAVVRVDIQQSLSAGDRLYVIGTNESLSAFEEAAT